MTIAVAIGLKRIGQVNTIVLRINDGVAIGVACAAFDHGAARHDTFVCFLYCSPGLVHAYMRLGFRPYPGYVIPNEDGIRLPMFMVASDLAHLRAVGSPLAPLMASHFGDRCTLPDLSPFARAIRELELHYETEVSRECRCDVDI